MRFPSRALQGAAQLPPCRHWDWDPSGQSEHLGQPGFTTTPSGHRAAAEVWGGRVLGHEGWWGAGSGSQDRIHGQDWSLWCPITPAGGLWILRPVPTATALAPSLTLSKQALNPHWPGSAVGVNSPQILAKAQREASGPANRLPEILLSLRFVFKIN